MDDDLNFILGNLIFGMQHCFNPTRWNMEENLNIFENERQPQCFWKWKETSIFFLIECYLSFWQWKTTLMFFKFKTT
jgi:hypothetical protein